MKLKILISALIIFVFFNIDEASGQKYFSSASITVSARVIQATEMAGVDMKMDEIIPGTEAEFDNDENNIPNLSIRSYEEKLVNLTINIPKNLRSSEGDELQIGYNIENYNGIKTETSFDNDWFDTYELYETIMTKENKINFMLTNGKIFAHADQSPGFYEGEINILLEYTAN